MSGDDRPVSPGIVETQEGEQALCKRVDVIRETIRGLHQDQQPCGAARTGRTHGCIRPALINTEKPFTPRRLSTHGFRQLHLTHLPGCGGRPPHHITRRCLRVCWSAVVALQLGGYRGAAVALPAKKLRDKSDRSLQQCFDQGRVLALTCINENAGSMLYHSCGGRPAKAPKEIAGQADGTMITPNSARLVHYQRSASNPFWARFLPEPPILASKTFDLNSRQSSPT